MSNPRPRPQVLTLTDAAVARVKAIMASKGAGDAGLKIGVKKGGCAGMEYTLDWAESAGKFDEVVERDGARVFNNPNQQSSCGCGESVNLMPASKDKLEALKV